MRRVSIIGACAILLSVIHLAAAQQWPSGDWNTEVIAIFDYAHRIHAGVDIEDDDLFVIKAGGQGIGGRTDEFTYVYKEISGDFEAWATVYTLENTNDWAKAGIMARQGLNTGAENVMVACRGVSDLIFQWREDVNGNSYDNVITSRALRPVTLRLIRRGNEFTSGWSLDYGETWEQNVTSIATVEMRDPILIGIAVTSHEVGAITAAMVEAAPPPPSRIFPEANLVTIETKQAVNIGETFSVDINISDVGGDAKGVGVELTGFRLNVSFNPDILQVVDVNEGSLLQNVGETYWLEPDIDNVRGIITDIESGLTGPYGTDVGGTLATVTFKAIGLGESYIRPVGRYYTRSPNIELHDLRWKPLIVISLYNNVTVYDENVSETAMLQNYPNPFNPETWMPYQLAEGSEVIVRIHNAAGKLIKILDLGYREAGSYVSKDAAAYWDGKNETGERVPSGVYFYNIQTNEYSSTRKMIIVQ